MKHFFVLLVCLLLVQHLPAFEAAIQCSDVINDVKPCVPFILTGIGAPSKQCCNGVKTLVAAASTTADRRAACTCIVNAAKGIQPIPGTLDTIVKTCGVNLPFPISSNMDCSKIN